jgi:hypothetical protein
MNPLILINQLNLPEFDYLKLLDLLKNYKSPRDQITKLLRKGYIVRIKKGLYVLGDLFSQPSSHFILANKIYGPSYVAGMTALSYYGMIPERVETIYSKTTGKHKEFMTPRGRFIYTKTSLEKFKFSVNRISESTKHSKTEEERYFLIASPEKSLVEIICEQEKIKTQDELCEFLSALRIEPSSLKHLKIKEIKMLKEYFSSHGKVLDFLINEIRKAKLL